MEIFQDRNNDKLTISLKGRLDTSTAPLLEAELKTSLNGVSELIFDCKDLAYISSAGLRVLLSAQKVMNKQGEMMIENVIPEVVDIFEVTGFVDILTIKQ